MIIVVRARGRRARARGPFMARTLARTHERTIRTRFAVAVPCELHNLCEAILFNFAMRRPARHGTERWWCWWVARSVRHTRC